MKEEAFEVYKDGKSKGTVRGVREDPSIVVSTNQLSPLSLVLECVLQDKDENNYLLSEIGDAYYIFYKVEEES